MILRELILDLRAKAEFVQARMIGLDVDRRLVLLDGDKQSIYYDYLSVNIGSVTRVRSLS
jgi:NADH dehydrogenase FAD-containing subunit